MANFIVTGGAGFIGSHTCFSLLQNGHKVFVIDSFINSSKKSLRNIISFLKLVDKNVDERLRVYECDIKNEEKLINTFKSIVNDHLIIDAVIHFAGLKDSNVSISKPLEYWDNNVNGAICLLKTMRSFECKTIVFSSSAAIYDASQINDFISEDSIKNPKTPYGQTKLVIEELLQNIFENSKEKWRIANLRYFNPIGANPDGIIGEDLNHSSSNIFPAILKVAKGYKSDLKIFGTNFETQDGTGIRDYIHVTDLAEAHIAAVNYLSNFQKKFISLNIGTGNGTSVIELIKIFEKVNKCKIKTTNDKKRIGDFPRVVANNKKAIDLLDWAPKRSIEDMCRDGLRWIVQNEHGYR